MASASASGKGKFYWDIIAVSSLFIGLSIAFVEFIFYKNQWDFQPFSGFAKPLAAMLLITPVGAILTARSLLQRKGYASFLEIVVHFLIIGMIGAVMFTGYSYVFETKIDPDYKHQVWNVHKKGIQDNYKDIHDKEKRMEYMEAMTRFSAQMDHELSQKPDFFLYLQKNMVRYLVMAAFYGTIFGFIFSKIYVAPSGSVSAPPADPELQDSSLPDEPVNVPESESSAPVNRVSGKNKKKKK